MATGTVIVIKVAKLSAHRIAHVVYDSELNAKQCILLSVALPIGTELRYQYDGNKTQWTLI